LGLTNTGDLILIQIYLGRLLIDWSVHDFLRFFIGMVADLGSPTHLACGLRMTGRRAGIALVSPRCRLARVRALSRSRCRPHFTEVIVGKIFLAVGIVTLCDHVLSVGHSDYSGGGPRGNILFRAGRLGTLTGVIDTAIIVEGGLAETFSLGRGVLEL
jgi:hypothetical protein